MGLPESTLNVPIGAKLFLTLETAAVRQIDAAIDALEAGMFDVALTLAGAAEGMIERTGMHIFDELKRSPEALAKFTRKEWISILNMERDWLKHGGPPSMEIHCSTAAFMIARASTKVENWSPRMVEFKIWMLANLDRI
jgi:hypothetical protein